MSFWAGAGDESADSADFAEVKVVQLTGAHDGGTAINPMAVEGQLEGSMHMAMGFALTEEVVWNEGSALNPSLASYAVPSPLDMPRTELVHIDSWDP
ncbi:MAG: molybdopterin-dependent oxidoreductase [Dehalococcoidia bacterium]|nr:molybdopterin-dependent oxidoreductase [Dehalococcoidia bacterium]